MSSLSIPKLGEKRAVYTAAEATSEIVTSGEKNKFSVAARVREGESTLEKAKRVLAEINARGIETSQKVIPCTEFYHALCSDEPSLYAKYGSRYFDYADIGARLSCARERYAKAASKMSRDIGNDPYVVQGAIALGENVAACGELSFLTETAARVEELYAMTIILRGAELTFADGTRATDDHTLNLVSSRPIALSKLVRTSDSCSGDFVKTMAALKGRGIVVIDAYLNKVIRAEDVAIDSEYLDLLRSLKVDVIKHSFVMSVTLEETLRDREALIARCKAMKPFELSSPGLSARFVMGERRALIVKNLEKLFPDTKGIWKYSSSQGCIFAESSEELVGHIGEMLKTAGVTVVAGKIKDKDSYLIKVNVKDYFAMQAVHKAIDAIANS